MVEPSPFRYQGPLDPDDVHGRDDVIAELTERVTAHRVTALLGPRRFGKTSVLRRMSADLSELTTVWVDLYEVTSMADVTVRFDEAIGGRRGAFGTSARDLAGALSFNLGAIKLELSRPARNRPDPVLSFKTLLDVLVGASLKSPTLLVIDEFSSISRVPGAAGALRTALQHHYSEIGLVFAGSHPSMMRTLFTDRAEPFYGQADLMHLGLLSSAAVQRIIDDGFAATGKDSGSVASYINQFCEGHPQRSMQLADACWRHTGSRETADLDVWSSALTEVRSSTAEGLERIYSGFGGGEKAVLRAIARSGSVYGAEATVLDLSPGSAGYARGTLIDSGDIVESGRHLRVVDPLFADWLRRRFPI